MIYTSARRGLDGSYGFCVVARTVGFFTPLQRQIVNFTHYRHIRPGMTVSDVNPDNYFHIVFNATNGVKHLISRTADAGCDYTNRPGNFIAHHVILDPNDLVSCGPAALCSSPHFFRSSWPDNRDPEEWKPRVLRSVEEKPKMCRKWKDLFGDAGFAGVLAGAVSARRTVFLVYDSEKNGADILPLFREAAALLPEKLRWQATFTTNDDGSLNAFNLCWRAVPSADARDLRRTPGSVLLDLVSGKTSNLSDFMSERAFAEYIDLARVGRKSIPAQAVLSRFPGRSKQDSVFGLHNPAANKSGNTPPVKKLVLKTTAEFEREEEEYELSSQKKKIIIGIIVLTLFGVLVGAGVSLLFIKSGNQRKEAE